MTARTTKQAAIDTVAQLLAVYAAARIIPFGIDKVTGTGSSLQGFAQIGARLGVDPTFFRFFVGIQELLVGLGLAAAVVAFVPRVPMLERLGRLGVRLAAPGLIATMLGAIGTEFYVRPGQQPWLVALAVQLLAVGIPLTAWTVVRFELPMLRSLRARSGPSTERAVT